MEDALVGGEGREGESGGGDCCSGGERGGPLLSRGCVKRSGPRRSAHRPLLRGVCRETGWCSNRKWQVKRSVSVRICPFARQRKKTLFFFWSSSGRSRFHAGNRPPLETVLRSFFVFR